MRRAEEAAARSHAAHKETVRRVADAARAIDSHLERAAAADRMAMDAMIGQRLSAASMQDLENRYLAAQFEAARLAEAKDAAEQRAHARWIELAEANDKLRRARLALEKIDALAVKVAERGAIREAALAELMAEEDRKPAEPQATSC
ncbi:hypothetical protein KEU06_00835 [Pseudaminobacter sp. 19-2017]|uniref:Uncharacterized protein n=1 Tax=Pseudaminobacter soli (ex Zhang et al. 2022) TaxID=2831468 RepID=A0A942DY76_9HYPH|nr:hypothetical protein [Pseudaminobacter soli]